MPDEALANERPVSATEMFMGGARLLALGGGLLLILAGAIFAIQVFLAVGALIKDPAALDGPVKTVEKLISADKLAVNANGQALEFGGLASMSVLFMWYVFWAWVPLALIAAGGKLVAACSQMREPPKR